MKQEYRQEIKGCIPILILMHNESSWRSHLKRHQYYFHKRFTSVVTIWTEAISVRKSLNGKITKLLKTQSSRKKKSKLSKSVAFSFWNQRLNPLCIKFERNDYKIEKPEQDCPVPLSHFHAQSLHILYQSQPQICPTVFCQDYRAREEYKQTALFPMEINKGQLFSYPLKSLCDYSDYEWLDKRLRHVLGEEPSVPSASRGQEECEPSQVSVLLF